MYMNTCIYIFIYMGMYLAIWIFLYVSSMMISTRSSIAQLHKFRFTPMATNDVIVCGVCPFYLFRYVPGVVLITIDI